MTLLDPCVTWHFYLQMQHHEPTQTQTSAYTPPRPVPTNVGGTGSTAAPAGSRRSFDEIDTNGDGVISREVKGPRSSFGHNQHILYMAGASHEFDPAFLVFVVGISLCCAATGGSAACTEQGRRGDRESAITAHLLNDATASASPGLTLPLLFRMLWLWQQGSHRASPSMDLQIQSPSAYRPA